MSILRCDLFAFETVTFPLTIDGRQDRLDILWVFVSDGLNNLILEQEDKKEHVFLFIYLLIYLLMCIYLFSVGKAVSTVVFVKGSRNSWTPDKNLHGMSGLSCLSSVI